ncbi:hypothetical protein ACJJTC_012699 [Scirpophaga incertulas]
MSEQKSNAKKKALFICLGNICRSPIAEGVFQKTVADMNVTDQWEIDSAAIGSWHVGNPPDWRAIDTMKRHGVPYNNCARQIVAEDFHNFDYIFGMDEANMKDLKRKAPKDCKAKTATFLVILIRKEIDLSETHIMIATVKDLKNAINNQLGAPKDFYKV